jgi:hypothetical protein
VQQTAADAGQRRFDADIDAMKKKEALAGATPRERVRRMFLGGLLGGLGSSPDQIQGVLGPNGATRQAAIREQMAQMVAQRREQQQERRTALLAQLDRQRRGETEDRRADLERQRIEETRRYHDELLSDSDARIAQGATRTENDTQRAELAAARAGRAGVAAATPGPVAPHGRGGPREVLHLPGDPAESGLPPEAQADRDAQVREYLEQRRQTDPEYYRAIRARLGSGASDYAVAQEIASNGETWGRTTGRRGADRSRNIRLLTSGASQDSRTATTDSRLAVTQARATAQREQRAVPFEEQGEFADEAAAALERIVAQTGDMGARVIRGDNVAASAAAAMAGADVETDRAVFRDFLSNLLHERGGASLTPQEKVIIQEALASGSIMTSSEATIRTLRNIAARARRRAQSERHTGGASAPASPSPSGGAPSWRAIGRATDGSIIYENTATGERRRMRRQ